MIIVRCLKVSEKKETLIGELNLIGACGVLPPSLKSLVFASRETTLTKYIKIYINIYDTQLISLYRFESSFL
jgi:hypothetical protein